jgi:hypothetical protein
MAALHWDTLGSNSARNGNHPVRGTGVEHREGCLRLEKRTGSYLGQRIRHNKVYGLHDDFSFRRLDGVTCGWKIYPYSLTEAFMLGPIERV